MGESMPELTYQVTGLVSGESLTTAPTLTCAADMTAVGEFDITVAGADAGSNYTITYEKGILTVKEADKASLRELVNRYQNTPQGNYTDDSWKVLQDALTGAKAVLSNQNATAAQIKAAMALCKLSAFPAVSLILFLIACFYEAFVDYRFHLKLPSTY